MLNQNNSSLKCVFLSGGKVERKGLHMGGKPQEANDIRGGDTTGSFHGGRDMGHIKSLKWRQQNRMEYQ